VCCPSQLSRPGRPPPRSSTNCGPTGCDLPDTSALAKLIVRETETAALDQWLRPRATQLRVTSIIGRVELVRVATCFAAAN